MTNEPMDTSGRVKDEFQRELEAMSFHYVSKVCAEYQMAAARYYYLKDELDAKRARERG